MEFKIILDSPFFSLICDPPHLTWMFYVFLICRLSWFSSILSDCYKLLIPAILELGFSNWVLLGTIAPAFALPAYRLPLPTSNLFI